jgi:drug/metabolite transporter (DMT)-like permease
MIGLDTVAQLLFKWSAERVGQIGDSARWLQAVSQSPAFWAGTFSLALTFPLWMLILRGARLNLAFPATALTYVGVIAGSRWVFGESIHWIQYCGMALIVLGVGLMRRPEN